jgi:hypothetical protein
LPDAECIKLLLRMDLLVSICPRRSVSIDSDAVIGHRRRAPVTDGTAG